MCVAPSAPFDRPNTAHIALLAVVCETSRTAGAKHRACTVALDSAASAARSQPVRPLCDSQCCAACRCHHLIANHHRIHSSVQNLIVSSLSRAAEPLLSPCTDAALNAPLRTGEHRNAPTRPIGHRPNSGPHQSHGVGRAYVARLAAELLKLRSVQDPHYPVSIAPPVHTDPLRHRATCFA